MSLALKMQSKHVNKETIVYYYYYYYYYYFSVDVDSSINTVFICCVTLFVFLCCLCVFCLLT